MDTDKIIFVSHYENQQCTLPLKKMSYAIPNKLLEAYNIYMNTDEQTRILAQGQLQLFEYAKCHCYRDNGNQGYLYNLDRTIKIGKFTKENNIILYTYFTKPYTVRQIFM